MWPRPLLRKLALHAVPLLLVVRATAARAGDDETGPPDIETPEPSRATPESERAEKAEREKAEKEKAEKGAAPEGSEPIHGDHYYPPPVDGPALRLPESPTRLYLDGAYAMSDDLTALPYIAGRGRNFRVALGGAWRWERFTFDAQVPFNVTRLDVTSILNGITPSEDDAHQTRFSLGDISLGAVWTERLVGDSEGLIGGLGVRGRVASHTTRFPFHLMDGTIADFVLPYYFHLEPTLILGGALGGGELGQFTWVLNQGAIILAGPDGDFDTLHITVPTIYLYDAHYALGWAPWTFLGTSVEVATTFQLNHIGGNDFQKFNGIRAFWVAPALQVHLGNTRIDAIARIGVTRGEEIYGVLEYVGTHSITLRVTRMFD
jgi:hypothetical protein